MKLSEKKRYTFVISYDWSFSYVKMDTAALLHKNLQIFIFFSLPFSFLNKKTLLMFRSAVAFQRYQFYWVS